MSPLMLSLSLAAALSVLQVDASASPSLLRSDRNARDLSIAADTGTWGITADYESTNCTGDFPVLIIAENSGCEVEEPSSDNCYSVSEMEGIEKTTKGQCVADLQATIDALYGDQAYLRVDYFSDSACSEATNVNVLVADGACHLVGYSPGISKIVSVLDDGSVSFSSFFNVSDCSGTADSVQTFTKEQLATGECKVYANGAGSSIGFSNTVTVGAGSSSGSNSGSGLSIGAIVGLVVSCIAFFG